MYGADVIQCYVGDIECSVDRPIKELKAYQKVFLEPGESKKVQLYLYKDAFEFYDVKKDDFVIEPGQFRVYVGDSLDNCGAAGDITL